MTKHRHIYRQKRTAVLILRVLHGGELSGELLLSARRAYSTAERVTDKSIRPFWKPKKPAISEYRSESRALPVSLRLRYMEGNRTENFQSEGLSGSSRMLFCTENPRCS